MEVYQLVVKSTWILLAQALFLMRGKQTSLCNMSILWLTLVLASSLFTLSTCAVLLYLLFFLEPLQKETDYLKMFNLPTSVTWLSLIWKNLSSVQVQRNNELPTWFLFSHWMFTSICRGQSEQKVLDSWSYILLVSWQKHFADGKLFLAVWNLEK